MRGFLVLALVLILSAAPAPGARAAGGGGGGGGGGDGGGGDGDTNSAAPEISASYREGLGAIKAERWDEAIKAFRFALIADGQTADTFNYLAYAHRKKGDLDTAFKFYAEALRLDPDHRGAHEYLGEAYLTVGNLVKAEEHLAILDDLCFFGCEEYDDLKAEITEYKTKNG